MRHFCESVHDPASPEFYSAFSSLGITLFACLCLFTGQHGNVLVKVCAAVLAWCGIGSFGFHWTLAEAWSFLDTFPMTIAAVLGMYLCWVVILDEAFFFLYSRPSSPSSSGVRKGSNKGGSSAATSPTGHPPPSLLLRRYVLVSPTPDKAPSHIPSLPTLPPSLPPSHHYSKSQWMSVLALFASGLLVWSLVLNVIYGNVFYDSLFTFLGLLLLTSALCLRALHLRRRRLEKEEGRKVGEWNCQPKRRRVSLVLACAGGCEEERKEGGREEKVEGRGFLVLDPRRSRRVCGDNKKDGMTEGQRKGKSTQVEVIEAGEAALLEEALLTLPSHGQHHDHHHHRHHHSWLLAVRIKETHYMPVLGGETQVSDL